MNMNVSEKFFSASSELPSESTGPKLVSLFCGAGGLDLGFINSGFDVVYAADYDLSAVQTYNRNHAGKRASQIDLLETSAAELYQQAVITPGLDGHIDGVIGGPPCQGFSRGNTGRCFSDPRNQLAVKYAEIVNYFFEHSKIKFFLFENVPEILASKNTEFLSMLREKLSENFIIHEKEINAANFGVPQQRHRYFIAGISKHIDSTSFKFPEPTALAHKTVREAIHGLPEPVYYKKGCGENDIPFHPNHWTMQPKSKRFLTGEMPTGGRSFIKLEWGKPSRTVAYGNREIHVHPEGHRRLSIYEAMQLQGFPKSYRLCGSLSAQVKQVSNAVPPPVATALAESLKGLLF